jgi:hypothetical protein
MCFIVRLIARPFMSLSDTTPAPNVAGTSYLAVVHRTDRTRFRQRCGTSTVAEQPVNLPTAIYLGVFSRAEQRVLQAIFKAIADGGGRCVATVAMLARDSNTSKSITRKPKRSQKTGRDALSSPLVQLLTWRQRGRGSCHHNDHSLQSPTFHHSRTEK